ncbi:cysteine dioxygenase [Herbaspirillum sp. YR522]|uniref:cysteine dioxygenase family protein n=1 Tax=Herbaspirillum sp. YR522 TaxID=1144342 RepID=UPI00026F76D9|nr:cysteine dioxygenase [Herbaspirillum sp. YR522]EJN01240.1 putative metal-dependent enzyme of the double-stranded beta helix superfamily [Herbaspirillum sp. YR522]
MTASTAAPLQWWRLRQFIGGLAHLLDQKPSEQRILCEGGDLLRQLVSVDDWLPPQYAQPDVQRYQQFLLHADSGQRFCVVSFVWGPGQSTPVHDHTVWGLIGMLRGAEYAQSFAAGGDALVPVGEAVRLEPGTVEAVSPTAAGLHDVHQVRNAFADRTSISIHVYGANIGAVRRSVYQTDGARKLFISGYSNTTLPNIWDLSANPALP